MEEFLLKGLSFMQKNVLHFPASGNTSTFAHWWMELFTECSKKNKLAQTDCRACNTRQLNNGCICHRWICNSYHWNPYFNWTVIFCNYPEIGSHQYQAPCRMTSCGFSCCLSKGHFSFCVAFGLWQPMSPRLLIF